MSITILSYHDQALVEQVNAKAAERTSTASQPTETASADFSTVLSEASQSQIKAENSSNSNECPEDLYSIFEEAATTFGVSINLLTSIAKAESNFRTDAVSHAGAVGVMQLMPATAASLGVTNSYDAKENIMGGAKLISQLLEKYNGNVSLALAAYNAGSGNVDKYGGIPPFTETQNYVQKVLSYYNTENRSDLKATLSSFVASNNVNTDTLNLIAGLLKAAKTNTSGSASSNLPNTAAFSGIPAMNTATITVEVASRSEAAPIADSIAPVNVLPNALVDTMDSAEPDDETADTTEDISDEAAISNTVVIPDGDDTVSDNNSTNTDDTVSDNNNTNTDDTVSDNNSTNMDDTVSNNSNASELNDIFDDDDKSVISDNSVNNDGTETMNTPTELS